MKRMLFNATHAEEFRVAIVDGQQLVDLDIESAVRVEKKGNIYKGVVTKVEPGLEAAFVDYGGSRQGFLPLKEIYRGYFSKYDSTSSLASVKIAEEIHEGQEMIVQVTRDQLGNKGAALTTFISLAGRFLVLMPNNPKGGGISRRVEGDDRSELREILASLEVDKNHAIIARTAGIDRSQEELQWDLDFLQKLWTTIEAAAKNIKAPQLIHQESNLIIRSIRDHLSGEVSEVLIDDEKIFTRTMRFMEQVMPHNLDKLKHYTESSPLFSRYQIEQQIDSAFKREVRLPSGGALVIDSTEAMVSIDVNSARATRGSDIEETALQTNLEAVAEIARQLRIRDLGGLVVIDLIDMNTTRNMRAVENALRDALRPDRARTQIGNISKFGLLEMSRQRLRSSIGDANYLTCPRCEGVGTIRSVVSSTLNLLRLIEDRVQSETTAGMQIILPLDMATYLLNEKRDELHQIEKRLGTRIIVVPSTHLASPHFQMKNLRSNELDTLNDIPTYQQQDIVNRREPVYAESKPKSSEQPQVQLEDIQHHAPPKQRRRNKPNWLARLWHSITANKPKPPVRKMSKPRQSYKNQKPTSRDNKSRAPSRNRVSNESRGRSHSRAGNEFRRSKFGSRVPAGRVPIKPKPQADPHNKPRQIDTPPNVMPERPTRSDFASHDPNKRVGFKRPNVSQSSPTKQPANN